MIQQAMKCCRKKYRANADRYCVYLYQKQAVWLIVFSIKYKP